MNGRRKVLDLFDEQKDFVNERVAYGIENYRKGDAKITVTDEKGNFDFRGFFGNYDIEIEISAGVERKTVNLSKNGLNEFTLVI